MRRMLALAASLALVVTLLPSALALGAVDHYLTVFDEAGQIENWPVTVVGPGPDQGAFIITDPACGTADQDFRAVLYDHGNYHGDRVILCRSESDFCSIPGHGWPLYIGCDIPWTYNHDNDEPLSIIVGSIKSDGACLKYFQHAGYSLSGDWVKLTENTWYPSIPKVGGAGSSIKRAFAGKC